jgi:hypothetical protein
MSCLSLSEQIAMELDHAARLRALAGDVLTVLDPAPSSLPRFSPVRAHDQRRVQFSFTRGAKPMIAQPNQRPEFAPWGRQAPPIFPHETADMMRAQSILSGGEIGQCPPLTLDQARDVLAWHEER